MAKFKCPQCGREVIAEASLEGKSADCARCGAHVESWPEPLRRTRKPESLASKLLQFAALLVLIVIAIMILKSIFGR